MRDPRDYQPLAGQLVVLARCVVDGEPEAPEDFGEGVGVICGNITNAVGVYAALVTIVTGAGLKPPSPTNGGQYTHEPAGGSVGEGEDHFIEMTAQVMTLALAEGPTSAGGHAAAESLYNAYQALEAYPGLVRSGLMLLPLHIVLIERTRGVDLLASQS